MTWDGAVALVTDTETDSVLYFVYLSGTHILKGHSGGYSRFLEGYSWELEWIC